MSKYFAPQRWMLYRFRAAWMSQGPLASDVLLISSASNERTIKVCAGNSIRGMKNFRDAGRCRKSFSRSEFSGGRNFLDFLKHHPLYSSGMKRLLDLGNLQRRAINPARV